MKRFFVTTALAALISAPAFADADNSKFVKNASALEVLGSEFIGARVYVAETEIDDDYRYEKGAEFEWDDIGEINNIVMTRDGEISSVVVGYGGLMGIGEKDVAVDMDAIRFVKNGEGPSDYFVVFQSNEAELEAAPEWEEAERVYAAEQRRAAMQERRGEMMDDTKGTMGSTYAAGMNASSDMESDSFEMVKVDAVKASNLIGASVFGSDDAEVGEISDVIISKTDAKKDAIIDVGGLLGIGEKPVSIPVDELRIMRAENGDELRVYVDASLERLENMPEYKL